MVSTVPAANMISSVISCSTKAESAVVKITEMAVPDDGTAKGPVMVLNQRKNKYKST